MCFLLCGFLLLCIDAMSDFERAVQIAFGPTNVDPKLKSQAEQYLLQLQQSEDGWSLSIATLQRSIQNYDPNGEQLLFWTLGTLVTCVPKKFPVLPDPEREQFCDMLFGWLATVVPSRNVPLFIKNKFAQLMVVAFELQWPTRWVNFWSTLFGLLSKCVDMIDVFLRILDTIDERIVDQDFVVDRQRSTLIKDAMREKCVTEIVATWYNILGAFHKDRPDLAQRCLQCMQNYVEWIDINLVTTEQWVNLLFYLFGLEQLREDACDCIFEIVSKRMENPSPKLKLLLRLNICQVLPDIIKHLVGEIEQEGEDYSEEQFGLKMARLAMTVGMELLDIIEKAEGHANQATATFESRQQAQAIAAEGLRLLDGALPWLFSLFGVPHTQISTGMNDFITQYVAKLKREPALSERHNAHIINLVNIIAKGIQYTDQYDFAKPCNDYETQVSEHRKNMFTVFKNLCSKSLLGQQFVQQQIADVVGALHSPTCTWHKVEATLALLFTLGEGMKQEVFRDPNSPLFVCMSLLTSSSVSNHPHQAVQTMFFENCERFCHFFMVCKDKLPIVLAAFLDKRGICNPNECVAYRAAYLFKNFVLSLKSVVIEFVGQVYSALQEILSVCEHDDTPDGKGLGIDEQLNLYETLGVLIGSEEIPYGKTLQFLEGLAAPLLSNMQMVVSSGALASNDPKSSEVAAIVANQISFIAYISKGFSSTMIPVEASGAVVGDNGKVEKRDISDVFMKILGAVLTVFDVGKTHSAIRDKTILFVHRMIDLLGDVMCPYIPKITLALLEVSTVPDLPKAIRIPMQMTKKAKAKAVPCITELFVPLVTRVFELTGVEALKQQNNVISDEVRQHSDLLRSYYHMLYCFLNSKCSEVLICPNNRPQLDNVLLTVIQGCTTHPELDLAKTCFQVLAPPSFRFSLSPTLPPTFCL